MEQNETTEQKTPRDRMRTAFRIIVILAACAVVIAILVTRFVGKNDGEESNPHIVVVGQSGATALPTLKRERLETCGYDGDGVLKLDVNDTEIDFSQNTGNVFGLTGETAFEAGNSVRAFMRVSNVGDDPFVFWLSVIQSNGKTVDGLTVTTEIFGETYIQTSDGGSVGSAYDPLATVEGGAGVTFEVEISVDGESVATAQAVDLVVYVSAAEQDRRAE